MTDRGICGLDFVPDGEQDRVLNEVKDKWPKATFVEDADQTRPFAERIFTPLEDKQALLKIPAGAVVSYNDIAAHIGQPKAARAVGNAVALNPIGFIIPCHRVIRKVGNMGDYRWGAARKKAIIGWEASRKV
jgi:AraC family transcriptional regulator of adaptative response/methylated-DNA-[protein]-cysteine methyltransferase